MTKPKNPEDKKRPGRKTVFKPEYVKQAFNYCLLGSTDKELSDLFGVNEKTLNRWKKQYPEFCLSLKSGKEKADSKVAERLFTRAIGYDYDEKTTEKKGKKIIKTRITKKQVAPDTTAAIFWLKNRQPELWRDRTETTINGGLTLKSELEKLSDEELKNIINNGKDSGPRFSEKD